MKNTKKIGLIVAIEMDSVFAHYPQIEELPCPVGYHLYRVQKETCELYILQTGMGEIAAAAGVQYLVAKCAVSVVVNYGVVGGLIAEMKQCKVCFVERVVHYKYDCSEFMDLAVGQVDGHDSIFLKTDENLLKMAKSVLELPVVTCCSGDKFIGTAEEKTYLHETFQGDICDMESAGIVLSCEMNGVPCLLMKAVSDGLADGADGFYTELQNASMCCLKVADQVIDRLSRESE